MTGDLALSIVADHYRFVVGVDTHAATHSYAIIECPSGRVTDESSFPTSATGLTRAATWLARRTHGEVDGVLIAAEGTGSYGAVLSERLERIGYRVVEAPAPSSKRLRNKGKTDALDALTAARATLTTEMQHLCDRRRGQVRAALNVLSVAREQMNTDRTRCINALTALVRAHDLGIDARRALTAAQIATIAGWRSRAEPLGVAVARTEAVRQARRIGELDTQLDDNRDQLTELVNEHAPQLLSLFGVGAVTAAVILTVWSHPGRIKTEAALAKIAGTCPIPASSGNTIRHRLNRGGDRRLNRVINTVVLTRMRADEATRAYVRRRLAEGRTQREIRRCLKRYITRQIFRTLTQISPGT
ncbi:IS110 family transposase [Nocardia sp. NPDC059246]|uniref:IS110 family transposase n=1 Tax=unclassified Nocardia TaxID=2637762 RepID=UPI0036AE0E60